jgi:hypothetical protein
VPGMRRDPMMPHKRRNAQSFAGLAPDTRHYLWSPRFFVAPGETPKCWSRSGRRVPAADVLNEPIGLWGAPGSRFVFIHRARILEKRIHDRPGSFDDVLPGEERGVACDGVTEQTFVVAKSGLNGVLDDRQFHLPT